MATKVEYKGYTLEFPDNATDDDIHKYIQENESQFDSIAPANQEAPKEEPQYEDDGLLGSLKRIDLNAGTSIANIPSAVADSVASAAAWAGGKLGIGDGTYIPATRFEVGEEDKPRGLVEEVASEAIPYLIPIPATTGVKAAGTAERVANALARNAAQSVVGSAASNSDGELGANFAADVALNAGVGAGIEKGIKTVGNTIKAGKQARRDRIAQALGEEKRIIGEAEDISTQVHNLSRGHNDLEKGIQLTGTTERSQPRSFGELQQLFKDNPEMFAQGGSLDYLPKQADDYLRTLTNNQYSLSGELPESIAGIIPTPETTKAVESTLLGQARDVFGQLERSQVGVVSRANDAISQGNILQRAFKPSVDVGSLSSGTQKALGLNKLERTIASIGSAMERNLPFDAGSYSRTFSNRAIAGEQKGIVDAADGVVAELDKKYQNKILKDASSGNLDEKSGRHFLQQRKAWEDSKSGKMVSELSDDDLNNFLVTDSQARINNARTLDDSITPTGVSTNLRELEGLTEAKPLGAGSLTSTAAAYLSGGASTAAQLGLAGANRILSGAVARDLARTQHGLLGDAGQELYKLDRVRNLTGRAVEDFAEKAPTGTYGQGDLDVENDDKLAKLDDWASKNGVSEEIMATAIAQKGADLGNIKGLNDIKHRAMELQIQERASNPDISVPDSYDSGYTINVRKVADAMWEAMSGLSPEEKEEIIDDYLDSNHLDEDDKLVGLKLQRAIQKGVQYALKKSEEKGE